MQHSPIAWSARITVPAGAVMAFEAVFAGLTHVVSLYEVAETPDGTSLTWCVEGLFTALPPKADIAAGSGFYSLTRQLGSSIGIAAITTALAHQETLHRSTLVEHVTASSPQANARLQLLDGAFRLHTADPVHAHQQALSVIDQTVNGQALLLSFADVFYYVAVAFIVTLPLLLLLGKGGNKEAAAAAH